MMRAEREEEMKSKMKSRGVKILSLIFLLLAFILTACSTEPVTISPETEIAPVTEVGEHVIEEDGAYYTDVDVAAYLRAYGHLPENYITKEEARKIGWIAEKGNLWEVTDRMVIGGDRFGNREGQLPTKKNRKYYEADVNYEGGHRGAERIVYSNDGLIFYTKDHYDTFEDRTHEETP